MNKILNRKQTKYLGRLNERRYMRIKLFICEGFVL